MYETIVFFSTATLSLTTFIGMWYIADQCLGYLRYYKYNYWKTVCAVAYLILMFVFCVIGLIIK